MSIRKGLEPSNERYSHTESTVTLNDNRNIDTESIPSQAPPSQTPPGGVWYWLNANVDADHSTAPLAAFSFMTGFMDAISFIAIFVWCGFQTGNFVQLSIAASRFISGALWHGETKFHRIDQQALTSIVAFTTGASLGRIGDKIGSSTRLWLFLGTFLQALFTVVASIAIWKSGQPSTSINGILAWTNLLSFVCIAFMSASLGLQGIMAKRLNTHFGTTVVLTTIWCELVSERKLFDRRWISSRDQKLLAAFCIFMGAFVGRALVDQIGAAGALGVGACTRVLIAFGWLFIPGR